MFLPELPSQKAGEASFNVVIPENLRSKFVRNPGIPRLNVHQPLFLQNILLTGF
jgi:hypothetical protein